MLLIEPSDGVVFTAYREVSDGSQPRTESDHVVAREAHGDVVTEPPRNQETSGRPASAATTRPLSYWNPFRSNLDDPPRKPHLCLVFEPGVRKRILEFPPFKRQKRGTR